MDRIVLFGALAFAALVAAGAIFGVGFPSFGMMGMEAVRPAVAGKFASQTFQARSVKISNAAVRLVVTPEDRQDVAIEIDNPGLLPMPEVKLDASRLDVNGRLRGRAKCKDDGGAIVKGYGAFDPDALPLIIMHVPQHVDFNFDAAGRAAIGAAQSVTLELAGCGAATIADVSATLTLEINGSGNLDAGTAAALKIKSAGASRVRLGAVKNGADVDIAGAPDINVARIDGAVDYHNAGAGELKVADGALQKVQIENAGAGRFELAAGAIDALSVNDSGAGYVKIVAPVRTLKANLAGAGTVIVDGTVGDVEASIAGAGEVKVKALTGAITKKVLGAGTVTVGQ